MKQRFVFLVLMIAFVLISGFISSATAQAKFKQGIETPYIVLNGDTLVSKSSVKAELVTDTQFEAIFDKYTAKAGEGFNKLLSSIKENFTDEAEYVWKVYTKRYKVPFLAALFLATMGVITTLLGAIFWKKALKLNDSYPGEETPGIFAIMFWILGGLGAVIGIVWMCSAFSAFLVPEYYVIQDLLGIIK